jgi:hypothetical protein
MRHSKAVMERTNIEAEIRQASEQLVGLEVLFVQQDFCIACEKIANTPFRKVLTTLHHCYWWRNYKQIFYIHWYNCIGVEVISSTVLLRKSRNTLSVATLRPISTQENFPQKQNFVKCDWPTHFVGKKFLKKNIFENFLSVENFLEWKWAFMVEMENSHKTIDGSIDDYILRILF